MVLYLFHEFRTGFPHIILGKHYGGLHHLAAHLVGHGRYGAFHHCRMGEACALHLERPDAVAR